MYKTILATFFMMFNVASEATHHIATGALLVNNKATGHVTFVESLEDSILIGWDGDDIIPCGGNTIKIDKNGGEAFLDRAFKIALTAKVTDEKIMVSLKGNGCNGSFLDAGRIRLCSDDASCPTSMVNIAIP